MQLIVAFLTFQSVLAAGTSSTLPDGSQTLSSRIIYEFDASVTAENIVPRKNGNILVTTEQAGDLFEIDPRQNNSGRLTSTFPRAQNTWGVVEVESDVFYVGTSNITGPPLWEGVQGSTQFFRVNMTTDEPAVSPVLTIEESFTCIGMTTLNASAGLVMTGDTQSGILYLIDVFENTYEAVYQNELLNETGADPSELSHVGLNGIRYSDGYLYFTSTARDLFARVPVDSTTGRSFGEFETLLTLNLPDDFLVQDGKAILTELERGLVALDVDASPPEDQDCPLPLLVDLLGANAVIWGIPEAGNECDLFILYDRVVINETGSGVAVVDGRGTALRDAC